MSGALIAHIETIGPGAAIGTERCSVSGKLKFDTEDAALEVAYEWAMANRFNLTSDSAYRCEHCHKWHITSRGRRRR